MRRRILSLLLILLLIASGCTAPQDSLNEPIHDATTTTADTVTGTDTTGSVGTTIGTQYVTTDSDSAATSPSTVAGSGTDATGDTPTSTHVTPNQTTSSIGATSHNTSAVDATTSISPATTVPQNTSITFKATVRENTKQQPVSGVTVTVYYSDVNTTPAGSGVTDRNGVVLIEMKQGTTYKVVLSNLPSGYEAVNPYSFSSSTVNITIKKSSIRNEEDHSGARYEKGSVMTNFTLTDTDGNVHHLSDLLKTKQLIILDFWYVACEPCKTEFPYFESVLKTYGDNVTLLAIDPLDSSRTISDLRKKLNANSKTAVTFPMMQDTCNLAAGFNATSYPVTVFINSDGVVLEIHDGAYTSEAAFRAAVERFLK